MDYRYITLREQLTELASQHEAMGIQLNRAAALAAELERDNQPDIAGNPTQPEE